MFQVPRKLSWVGLQQHCTANIPEAHFVRRNKAPELARESVDIWDLRKKLSIFAKSFLEIVFEEI